MQLDAIKKFTKADMEQVDQIIAAQLGSDVSLIKELGEHIFGSGGKRLRPILVILSAKAFAYEGTQHQQLAAIIELIHTATLLHDDVVDASTLRRGRETANKIWGDDASVLVGDFVYSRSFQMMVQVGRMEVMDILANASNTIAEGEVMQLINSKQVHTTEEQYLEVIKRKTATLFEAGAQIGAVLCDRSANEIEAMRLYGMHLGTAFQLIDDALDYGASSIDIGKNVGDDLAEGKPTLPIIHALKHSNETQKALIENAISQASTEHLDEIVKAIHNTGAIEYTYEAANQQVDLALTQLQAIPESPVRDLLVDLAKFAVARKF